MKEKLSIIIPVWGEKELVPILYERLITVLKQLPVTYEIIYINDACPFGSIEELKKLVEKDQNIKLINLSRNFGEAIAVKVGIDNCDSDYAVIMDCDLQDNPEDITRLFNKAKEGFDIVWGERSKRNDNCFKKLCSNTFYKINNCLSDRKIEKKIGSFSIISKRVIDILKEINTSTFNYIQMVEYAGFKKAYIPIIKEKRKLGKSGYNFFKGLSLALNNIVSISNKLLLFPFICSILSFVILIIFTIFSIYNYIFSKNVFPAKYFISLFILLFFFFILFLSMSILAIYIGTILKEVLKRPNYIIESEISNKQKK